MPDSTFHSKLKKQFNILLKKSCNIDLLKMDSLPGDASKRKYFRLYHDEGTLIGVYGQDDRENRSFIYFCKHLYSLRLPVPMLYTSSIDKGIYIIEDMGDETLAERISSPSISREEVLSLYIQSAKDLVDFQILGHVGIDYEHNCHQSPVFDRKNIEDDLRYFMNNFFVLADDYLKIPGIENELNRLTDILAGHQPMFFLYRDFQCRNIMVRPDRSLGYVDFQAGRQGPLQYDVATLLYASKANISDEERKINFNTYQIWLLAMLNNEQLWEKAQDIAITLNTYSLSDKNAKKVKSQEVKNLLASVNKKQFIESLIEIVKGSPETNQLVEIAEIIHTMPVDNVPYFLTLIRFQYAVVNK